MNLPAILISIVLPFGLVIGQAEEATTHRSLATNFWNNTIPSAPPKPTFSFSTPRPTPSPTAKPTLSPIPTPSQSPTPTPSPRLASTTPRPSATPIPKPSQTPLPSSQTTSVKSYIMNAINNYRKSQGLSTVQTDPYTCSFAAMRAKEISQNFSHDGFRNRLNNKNLPYPSYSQVTENIAMNSKYQNVVNKWINSPGHAENIRKDTPFVCVESSGKYYAYEGWKP